MQLVLPSVTYKKSFLEALQEYQSVKADDRLDIYELSLLGLQADFPKYIKNLLSESSGKNLPQGYVPQTTYWLIDNDEFIGRLSVRHMLTDSLLKFGGHIGYDIRPAKRQMGYGKKILALGLVRAEALGIEKALITCDVTNIASKKIIEANGGVFEDSIDMGEDNPRKLRYWITLR
ncbi:MAG: GNAT family N-acetyltransferase [Candidatus Levybacteria bacterium]|nr:GNAT family N-acetyltransferase [Candidatus Levybacteria bacterium]